MLIKITCPSCSSDTGFSVAKGSYKGPFRCWKCKSIFNITIEGNEVKSCAPFNQDDAWKIEKLKY